MTSKRLEALLHNSEALLDSSNKGENTQLQRDLGQIASESHLLQSRLGTDPGLNTRAHYFLAQSGANSQDISEILNTVDTRITFQPQERITDIDVESYLNSVQKEIVIKTVGEARHNTRREFLERLDNNLDRQWQDAQRQIFEDWDIEQENKRFGRRTQGKAKEMLDFRKQLLAYASTVTNLNQNRLLSDKVPIIKKFQSLSSYTKCDKNQERAMSDSWSIASFLANESRESESPIKSPYHYNSDDKSAIVEMKRSLIGSAKSWLESEFSKHINDTLNKNANEARVGGTPSLEKRIRAFMKLNFSKNAIWIDESLEIQAEVPIWLYTYLLIRSGHPDLALNFVNQEVQSFYLSHQFPGYLKEYISSPSKLVSEKTRLEMLEEYQRMVYGSIPADPYKKLLYKIIGRCELEKADIPNVIATTEDFMWFELSLIREYVDEERHNYERYRLSNLQKKISGAGSKHFDPNDSNPWYYFKVLLLSMQFEKAIEYLYKSENFRLEAVHFGIALAYHGLIRIPKEPRYNIFELLVTELDGTVGLNFSRLISQYVQLFVSDDADSALQYLYLISVYPTEDMIILCQQNIIDYVVKCKDHQKLIGCISTNGSQPRAGIIEKFRPLFGIDNYDVQTYKNSILYPIANKFQAKSDYKNAVSVYELSGRYTDALGVLNNQLDRALNKADVGLSELDKKELAEFSVRTKARYDSNVDIVCSDDVKTIHDILLGFLKALIVYKNGDYSQTIEIIKSTKVLPKENNITTVQSAVDRLKKPENYIISKHISEVLEITLDSYHKLCQNYTARNSNLYNVNQRNMEAIKEEVSIIMCFLGLIEFDIPRDTVKSLSQKMTFLMNK